MAQQYGEQIGQMMTYFTGDFGLPPFANLTVVETENGAPNGYAAPGLIFLNPHAIGQQVGAKLLAQPNLPPVVGRTGLAHYPQSSLAHQRPGSLFGTCFGPSIPPVPARSNRNSATMRWKP